MRGTEPADGSFESAFAMTILPSKAAGRSRKSKAVEPPAFAEPPSGLAPEAAAPHQPVPAQLYAAAPAPPVPVLTAAGQAPTWAAPPQAPPAQAPGEYVQSYPPAPGFPPPPPYVTGETYVPPQIVPFGVPPQAPDPGQPGFPPPGYAHIDFLDDPTAESAPRPSKRRGLVLIAVPVVLALAAGGYLFGPKLLGGSSASAKPPTIVLPAKIGTLSKNIDATTLAHVRASMPKVRAESPALATVAGAFYGPSKASTVVIAGLLPATVVAKTAAEQTALATAINKAAHPAATLTLAAQPNTKGQLWCSFTAGKGAALGSSDCLWVDRYAVV
ncbi:MAG: hypothetical protein QOJ62_2407, partial [Actinomycetota bacterium]|nr:hypothetical protein [Actinomycetota bacterium]